MIPNEIKQLIGKHNYYRVGIWDAMRYVRESIDRLGYTLPEYVVTDSLNIGIPFEYIEIGKTKVHAHDLPIKIYVVKIPKTILVRQYLLYIACFVSANGGIYHNSANNGRFVLTTKSLIFQIKENDRWKNIEYGELDNIRMENNCIYGMHSCL